MGAHGVLGNKAFGYIFLDSPLGTRVGTDSAVEDPKLSKKNAESTASAECL
jgi:hypothetical protein